MQIRATVKWRQSLPLTRPSTPSPSLFLVSSSPARWTHGVFQLLTLFQPPLPPPPPSLSPLFTLPLSAATPPPPPRLAPDFHTPATALPAQVEGGNTHPPACFRVASAPACTTRRIYMHCNFIGRSCSGTRRHKQPARQRAHAHTRANSPTIHSCLRPPLSDEPQAVIETPETRIYFTTSPFPTPKHHQNGREAASSPLLFLPWPPNLSFVVVEC